MSSRVSRRRRRKSKEEKITTPFFSPIERARLIGVRAEQIDNGAETTLTDDQIEELAQIHPSMSSFIIATQELKEGVIPVKIQRNLPSGEKEPWRMKDFSF